MAGSFLESAVGPKRTNRQAFHEDRPRCCWLHEDRPRCCWPANYRCWAFLGRTRDGIARRAAQYAADRCRGGRRSSRYSARMVGIAVIAFLEPAPVVFKVVQCFHSALCTLLYTFMRLVPERNRILVRSRSHKTNSTR